MSGAENEAAVFVREGEAFVPTEHAVGPWARDRLHGGPVLGLLARAFEVEAGGEEGWLPSRFTFDLYRPVPRAPLQVVTEVLRSSGRLRLLSASLRSERGEVARGTALSLRSGGADASGRRFDRVLAPDPHHGLPTESLMRGRPANLGMPRGFHTSVETRWPARLLDGPLSIWFRMPLPLVAGEPTSDFQRAAALSDFCNALASFSARDSGLGSPPYINTDTTLYVSRPPRGEWICLLEERSQEHDGISLSQSVLCDEQGDFARALQARLANR